MTGENSHYLVDGKYSIRDLVDLEELRKIFESFTLATGFTVGVLEYPSQNILLATGWRDICTKFHRSCPDSVKRCLESNARLTGQFKEAGQLVIEECENGLVDCAIPIIIKGTHVGTLVTGQVLFREPDLKRFKKQAETYGYDVDKYLTTLSKVPVVSHKKLKAMTLFFNEIAMLIANLGLNNQKIREHAVVLEKTIDERNQIEVRLREREAFIRTVLDNLPVGIAVNSVDPSVEFEYMNNNFPKFYRTTREALADPDAFWEAVYEDAVFREKIWKRVLDDCASGDPGRMLWADVPITRKGEKTTFITAQNIPIPNKKLMISMVWDITERKISEGEIQKRIKELEEFYDMAIGRELRMKELKEEMEEMKEEMELLKHELDKYKKQ